MKKTWLVALTFILMLCTQTVFAVKVENLFQAEVPVTSQTSQERHQVLPEALAQVLIKISGNSQILDNPRVKSRLPSAGSLVQEFGYTTPKNTDNTKPYLLQVRFDPKGVTQWLRDASAPIWGQNRPLILAWIEYQTPDHPAEIIGSDSNKIIPLLKYYADRRGIPFIFPLMDVTDLNQMTTSSLQSMSAAELQNAGKRYRSNATLTGRLINDPNLGLTSQWKLIFGNDQWEWTVTQKTEPELLNALIDNIANTLATRFAVVTTNNIQKHIVLKVIGITEQTDFAQLIRYLNHLTPVADVGILRIDGSEIILNVSLRSTQQAFTHAVSQGLRLTPLDTQPNAASLNYQWNH